MNIIARWWTVVAAFTALMSTSVSLTAAPGDPGGPGEYRDFKVIKSYSAQSGDHLFRAFVIEWEGQHVIARDVGALVNARSDHTINVLVSRGLPRSGEGSARIVFLARPEKKPPLSRDQMIDPSTAGPPLVVDLKVNKVYTLQGGDYAFRAYEVTWEGQEVIVHDILGQTTHKVGDTVRVGVSRRSHFDLSKPYGMMDFFLLPERNTAPFSRRR